MSMIQHHHHRISTCHRHPIKPITGFCASCLRERLAGIHPDTQHEAPITSLAADLRRSKSYSSSSHFNNASSTSTNATTTASVTTSEPRRKSCDVSVRNTLSDLFVIDDKGRHGGLSRMLKKKEFDLGIQVELKEEDENVGEIRVSEESYKIERNMEGFEEEKGEFKTMKEFIDLEWEKKNKNRGKDFGFLAGGFWEAASVFSKKLQKWQRKEEKNKEKNEKKEGVEKINGLIGMEKMRFMRKLRETQSEVGDYGLGMRSCDTDPRLSLDVARLSVDDSRCSFDKPRASWDGYLISKSYPGFTPLVSVIEDVKLPAKNSDEVIESLQENVNGNNDGESSPGGMAQTRSYYSGRGRRSFDWSNSNRRLELGDEELKSASNAMVSPSETVGLFHGAKLLVTEKELRDSNWYSIKNSHVDTVGSPPKDVGSVAAGANKKGFTFKKSQRWHSVWNIWGLMRRKSESKYDVDDSRIGGGNMVHEPEAQSWGKPSGVSNGIAANGSVSQKLIRSYTLSAREYSSMVRGASGTEAKENVPRKREELMLHQCRSAKYSPNNLDNSLLRFHLTPLRSYGRNKSGTCRVKN